ncbi:class I glutamine amidotransferase-like protein [Talaromyces proteolyticus]|uniref:Class I glutamine amidotransferase-like protein n=1 Tax=Talaromyces proteolyticus TaxID=1131652 RepID=A0AAD4L2M3_9EURO|nr:class I glutamine amidotransferase-like protein [Talaromyces proteolyticus]KAH8705465.1 class I glutamine amidotransferase-like protein [Talaromyces proteolyticus]
MRPPLRIAILECDTPADKVKAKYGTYGDIFERLLKSSALSLGEINPDTDLAISKFDIVNDTKYPNIDDIDAVLLTGSKHDSFADVPWINTLVEFTKKVYSDERVRLIGVCFGHQIIGRALGVPVGRSDIGWEVAVCEVDLTEKGKELFGKEKLYIHQMHRDIVGAWPKGVEPLGTSPRCTVQGMYAAQKLITVQGHPEFNSEIMLEILDGRHKLGIFSAEVYNEASSRAANVHDGLAVGAAFLKFLLDD